MTEFYVCSHMSVANLIDFADSITEISCSKILFSLLPQLTLLTLHLAVRVRT